MKVSSKHEVNLPLETLEWQHLQQGGRMALLDRDKLKAGASVVPFKRDNTTVKPTLKAQPGKQDYSRDQGTISAYDKSPRERLMSSMYKLGNVGNGALTGLVSAPIVSGAKLLRADKYFDGVDSDSKLRSAVGDMAMDAINVLPLASVAKPVGRLLAKSGAQAISALPHPLAKLLPEALAAGEMGTYAKAATIGVANRLAPIVSKTPILKDVYKAAAYRVAGQSGAASRGVADVFKAWKKPKYENYTGGVESVEGPRNLLRNYIYGDNRGFEVSDLPTTGLDKYHKMYPDMKKYKMLTESTGESLGDPGVYSVLGDYIKQKGLEGTGIAKRILEKRDYAGALKRLTSNNKTISVGLESNPISPTDDIAGHMGFISRDGVGGYKFKSQDIWKFTPEDYNKKWLDTHVSRDASIHDKLDAYLKPKMAGLMDKAGKPVILMDERPIKLSGLPGRVRSSKQLDGAEPPFPTIKHTL